MKPLSHLITVNWQYHRKCSLPELQLLDISMTHNFRPNERGGDSVPERRDEYSHLRERAWKVIVVLTIISQIDNDVSFWIFWQIYILTSEHSMISSLKVDGERSGFENISCHKCHHFDWHNVNNVLLIPYPLKLCRGNATTRKVMDANHVTPPPPPLPSLYWKSICTQLISGSLSIPRYFLIVYMY